jgi:hypothetical protein
VSQVAGSPLLARIATVGLSGIAAAVSALSIAICSAAPELIWQGSKIAFRHVSQSELLSALLIGLVLAFLVDPLMERIRRLPSWEEKPSTTAVSRPRSPLFTAGIGLAFALVSVCLHDALTTFVSGRSGEHTADFSGLDAAIELTAAWAFVPFFVTLAWLSARHRWVGIPLGIIAVASPFFAGWLFSWSWQEIVTTAIPCGLILLLGYRQAVRKSWQRGFARCAKIVGAAALTWLAIAAIVRLAFDVFHIAPFRLYDMFGFWIDVRFYLGWVIGLELTPFPFTVMPATADNVPGARNPRGATLGDAPAVTVRSFGPE